MFMIKCKDCGSPKSRKGLYCKKCGYKHRIRPKGLIYEKHKENPTSFKKGASPWNKGKIMKSLSSYQLGDKSELHKWLRRHWGNPKKCKVCGDTKNIQWANKTGKYLRKRSDWLQLCKKCHPRYDYEKFGARKVFYEKGNPTYV